jgi:hypothetical protein
MQRPTGEASIPTVYERTGPKMSGTMRRKIGIRSYPWETAAAANLTSSSPSSPPPQDDDSPAAKRLRLQTPTIIPTADTVVDAHATEVAKTASGAVTVAALLPSGEASRVPCPSWKPEEDAELTEAVKELGKDWVAVAALVPRRTCAQCHYRWATQLEPDINLGIWTVEEDAKLTDAVEKLGKDWAQVAAMFPGRTDKQCRYRWVKSLDPDITSGKWTVEEDAKLTGAVQKYGDNNWIEAAALVPGRKNSQCRQRWVLSLDPTIDQKITRMDNKGKWTVEEDSKLTEAVEELGKDWVRVAVMVLGRTNQQCRYRWVEILDPDIKRRGWALEEDAKLTDAVKKLGKDWAAAAAMVPGRTKKQCRYRWIENLDPDINSGRWTAEEDAKLTVAVKEFGTKWARVAATVPSRSNIQCRHRWVTHLGPRIDHTSARAGKWITEEDAKLIEAVKKHGDNHWVAAAALVPGRTNTQCRQRWHYTLKPMINGVADSA